MSDEARKYLDEVRARCDAATPGEWGIAGGPHPRDIIVGSGFKMIANVGIGAFQDENEGNAAFIANARADLDRLERFARAAYDAAERLSDVALGFVRDESIDAGESQENIDAWWENTECESREGITAWHHALAILRGDE